MSDLAIRVDSLSKAYRIGLREEIPDTLLGAAKGVLSAPWRNWRRLRRLSTYEGAVSGQRSATNDTNGSVQIQNPKSKIQNDNEDTIWALKDVSFEVREGEVVGVIGRNGAGKSTLLKILSRITEPTRGRAELRGRVSSLLEVGTGFHPELTGRENVYMNGTILGMTKREIDRKFDEIVDFSGVEKFLDTPVKRYSSGMTVRLAFAVAAHLEPEILIIDEVLAVGDAEFQRKCLGKMQDVARGGRTVLFVSHNMAAVDALCRSAILLDSGTVGAVGQTSRVLSLYISTIPRACNSPPQLRRQRFQSGSEPSFYLEAADLTDEAGNSVSTLWLGQEMRIRLMCRISRDLNSALIGVGIDDVYGRRILSLRSNPIRDCIARSPGRLSVHCVVPGLPLAPGTYNVRIVMRNHGTDVDVIENALTFAIENGNALADGRGFHDGICVAESRWSVSPVDSPAHVEAALPPVL